MVDVPVRPSKLLDGRVALVVGGGQTEGEGVGNGRATALLFGREGAIVVVADKNLESATETVRQIVDGGGEAWPLEIDVIEEPSIAAGVAAVVERHGRVDVLHNNVGASIAAGDSPLSEIEPDGFDSVIALNLRSAVLTCKHVLPSMRSQRQGVITNVSSIAAVIDYRNIGYKTAKAGVNALTTTLAISNAEYGIRANAIMPGLMNTPMAMESRVHLEQADRAELTAARNAKVPLLHRMGTGWDVAKAALFLASDEASFITGALLPVDGGQAVNVG